MVIRQNIPISQLTTMRLGGDARFLVDVEKPEDVEEAFALARDHKMPVWMMGAGANTIGHDEGFDGIIIRNLMLGVEILSEENGELIIKAMGGEIWDHFVEFVCEKGYTGIEAMSKIPGTVGAAPVQNIGAYGQDIAQVLVEVEAYDREEQKFVTIPKSEMRMTYRHTIFNHGQDAGRYFITSATLKLRKGNLQPPYYNSLQKYIDDHRETDFSPQNIRKMVAEIRADKLPDPDYVASSGSFFKNVYLNAEETKKAEENGIKLWKNPDGTGKINSGWLIEECGLKGQEFYGFRVSDKAALVLINESAKSYADLDRARNRIINEVHKKFGYILEQEPVEIPIGAEEK